MIFEKFWAGNMSFIWGLFWCIKGMCFGNNWLYFMWFKSQIDVKFGSLRGRLEKDLFFSEVNCHGLFFTWINFFSSYFAKKATKIFFQGKLTRHFYLPGERKITFKISSYEVPALFWIIFFRLHNSIAKY